MMAKRYTALILALLFMLSVALPCFANASSDFAGGDGTKDNPYLISTKEQLDNIRYYLDSNFKLTNDIVFEDADYKEGGAFYNNNSCFLPIGDEGNPFRGTIDGNNFSIKNLKQNLTSGICGGFIAVGEDCTIKNLTFENSLLYLKTNEEEACAGIVIACANKSFNIESVWVKNSSMIVDSDNSTCIGGIGGAIENGFAKSCGISESTIDFKTLSDNETEKVTVIGQLFGVFYGEDILECVVDQNDLMLNSVSGAGGTSLSVGGVVGLTNANIKDVSVLNITKTSVVANGNSHGGLNVVTGGIAAIAQNDGEKERTINAVKYENRIDVNATSYEQGGNNVFVGSAAGMIQGYTIENMQFDPERASIKAVAKAIGSEGQATVTGGGFVGYASNSKLLNLKNTIDILIDVIAEEGTYLMGGIAGIAENCEIVHSSNERKNIFYNVSKATSLIANGGIVGQQIGGRISECFNTKEVMSRYGGAYMSCLGGIVGISTSGEITDCYNKGQFESQDSNVEIGGIAGEIQDSKIINSYSKGSITYVSQEAENGYLGYVAGAALGNSKIDNCYYIAERVYLNINGNIFDGSDLLYDVGGYEETCEIKTKEISTEQMNMIESYAGFDFQNIWETGIITPELKNNPERVQSVDPTSTPTVTATPKPTPTPVPTPNGLFAVGDVNADGKINSRDLALLQRNVMGMIEFEGDQWARANVLSTDGSNTINSRDIAALQKLVIAG